MGKSGTYHGQERSSDRNEDFIGCIIWMEHNMPWRELDGERIVELPR
jgi:hypothetical protein